MPIEHSDIGLAEIHLVHNWEYANAAARTGASGFIASDVGKWAKQLDDGSFWELTATTPTWAQRTGVVDDSVTNAKLANMATQTIKGRTTAGTGDPEDLTATQATAILNAVVGDSGSGGTKGLVPAPGAGDAAAGKFLKADGSFAVPPGVGGPATQIEESSGPTTLDIGAIVDGEFLKRVGTEIVSDSVASSGPATQIDETGGPTTLDIAAIADGEFLKRSGTTIVGDTPGAGGAVNPTSLFVPYNNAGTFADSRIKRENTNITALNGGLNTPQTFNIYKTDDGSGNARFLQLADNGSNVWEILATGTGSGGTQNMRLRVSGGGTGIDIGTSSFQPNADRGFNLGGGGNRWNQAFFFQVVVNGGDITFQSAAKLLSPADGMLTIRDQSNNGASGTLRFEERTPSQITSNQNDYAVPVPAYFIRMTTDASRDMTGLTFTNGGKGAGQVHLLVNVGSNDLVLKHENAGSSAANRFLNSTGADITLSANQAAEIIYDGTVQRWRVFKRN